MKAVNVYFDDEDFEALLRVKGKQTWNKFILDNCTKTIEVNELHNLHYKATEEAKQLGYNTLKELLIAKGMIKD